MRKAWIFAFAALFLSAAAFAETPSAPLSLEAFTAALGQPAVGDACATQTSKVLFASKRPTPTAVCTAGAACHNGTTVSCSGGGTCTSVDSNCGNGERGRVTCDGVTTYCPLCPCNDTPVCCRCERYGDCQSCCRCGGGTIIQCSFECGS